jgi:hypothetical protein
MNKFSHSLPPTVPKAQPTLANLQDWAKGVVLWGSQLVGKLQTLSVSTTDIPAFQNTISPANELAYLQVSSTGQTIVPRTASNVLTDIGIPVPGVSNELDMIRVNAGGTAYEARTPAQVLSDIGAAALAGSASQNFSVADATTAHQAVAFEQVKNTVGVSADSVTTATTLTVTTGTFTAPSTGLLMVFGDGVLGTSFSSGTLLTTSLAGFVSMGAHTINPSLYARGYLPMTASQTTTCSLNVTMTGSSTIALSISTFFLPLA